jgi:hypothetical protein
VPHGYCIECDARVTAVDGTCLLGHRIDPSTISSKRGRRIAALEAGSEPGGVALLERPHADRSDAPRIDLPRVTLPKIDALRAQAPSAPRRDRPAPERPAGALARPVVPARPSRTPAVTDDLNPTGEFVVQLWDQTTDAPPLEDWIPADPLSSVPERDPIRFVSLGLIGAAAGAVVFAIALLVGAAGSDSELLSSRSETLVAAIDEFDVSTSSPDFSSMDAAARDVLAAADALDVGDPDRAIAIDAAGRVLDVERTLSDALSYETGFVVFVGRPELPTTAGETELSNVSAEFTSWVTDFGKVLDSVPEDRAFAEHAAVIESFQVQIGVLQATYLDALRSGDSATASEQLALVDEAVGQLQNSLAAGITATERASQSSLDEVTSMLGRLTATD